MKHPLSTEHKQQFEEMKKELTIIGAKEGNFIRVELMFYDAISVARTYGEDLADNSLLDAFKQLQAKQYQETKRMYNKSVQRERVIRRFISSLRTVLAAGIKNTYYQPQFS